MPTRVKIIINASAGTPEDPEQQQRLLEIFAAGGLEASVSLASSGAEIIELAQQAARGDYQIIVAGGGDGTINAVASQLLGTGITLGVLPQGTFNFFSRNLNIPQEMEDAARTIVAGHIVDVDVCDVNGKMFFNNSSIGLYPTLIREREKTYSRWGRSKLTSFASVALAMLRPSSFLRVRLTVAAKEINSRTLLVYIGCNKFQMESYKLGGLDCLDAGEFVLYLTRAAGRLQLIWLAMLTLFGRAQEADNLEVLCAKELWIETRRKRVRVANDGEVFILESPLHFRMRPAALRVIVPQ